MKEQTQPIDIKAINEKIEKESAFVELLTLEINKVIVGQKHMIERLLIGLLGQGHILLEGVPGLAKTLAINTLSQAVSGAFSRIQFTPDLLPADVIGTLIYNMKSNDFTIKKGPIFANFVLADEINRAPAKVQSALLEAMQEGHVTVGERTLNLPDPFFVLATQNPIAQEGTYPLPEAQLDRFLFNIVVDYPNAEEEREIIRRVTSPSSATVSPLMTGPEIIELQNIVKRVPVGDHVIDFAAKLARATRPGSSEAPDFVKEMVGWGAGPRAGISLISAAKAHAVLRGRVHATTVDVASVALPVLRHRVLSTFNAEAAGVKSDDIIKRLIEELSGKDADIKI